VKSLFHLLSEDDAFLAIPECTAKSLDFGFCIPNSCVFRCEPREVLNNWEVDTKDKPVKDIKLIRTEALR